jgi:integrase
MSLPDSASMTLTDLLRQYLAERMASPNYVASLTRTVRRATSYGLVEVSQLNPATVNDFLRALTCGPTTRANQRRELLSLWRYAYEQAITEVRPERIMRIRPNRRPPDAWSRHTLIRLLEAAEQDTRHLHSRCKTVLWSQVLPVWIVVGFDTGLRLGDLLALRGQDFQNGCVRVVAQKTGKPTVRAVSDYGISLVSALLAKSPDGTLFKWCLKRRRALNKWREFLDELGVSGSSKYLRRSAATFVENRRPGSASAFLSHTDPGLARQHYIDQTLLDIPEGPEPLR